MTNFVIIDDYDEYLSARFPGHFVHVKSGLFSENNAQKAYQLLTQDIEASPSLIANESP